jgi:hypothetical protein
VAIYQSSSFLRHPCHHLCRCPLWWVFSCPHSRMPICPTQVSSRTGIHNSLDSTWKILSLSWSCPFPHGYPVFQNQTSPCPHDQTSIRPSNIPAYTLSGAPWSACFYWCSVYAIRSGNLAAPFSSFLWAFACISCSVGRDLNCTQEPTFPQIFNCMWIAAPSLSHASPGPSWPWPMFSVVASAPLRHLLALLGTSVKDACVPCCTRFDLKSIIAINSGH